MIGAAPGRPAAAAPPGRRPAGPGPPARRRHGGNCRTAAAGRLRRRRPHRPPAGPATARWSRPAPGRPRPRAALEHRRPGRRRRRRGRRPRPPAACSRPRRRRRRATVRMVPSTGLLDRGVGAVAGPREGLGQVEPGADAGSRGPGQALGHAPQDLRQDHPRVAPGAHERAVAQALRQVGHVASGAGGTASISAATASQRQGHVGAGVAVGHRVDVEPVEGGPVRDQGVAIGAHDRGEVSVPRGSCAAPMGRPLSVRLCHCRPGASRVPRRPSGAVPGAATASQGTR